MKYQYAAVATLIAVVLGSMATLLALRALSLPASPSEDRIPSAPLQRLGVAALASSLVPAVAAVWVIIYAGLEGYGTRSAVRLLVQLLGVFAVVAAAAPVLLARRRAAKGELRLDERDEQILAGAPVTQSWIVLTLIVSWSIALTELYWDSGAVPVGAVALVLWTTLMAWAIALPLGIVLGYRRA